MPAPSPAVQDRKISLVDVATCRADGKCYVGVTSRGLRERIRKPVNRAQLASRLAFHRALRKYGAEGVERRGKISMQRKGTRATLETRLKLAEALRGRRLSDASRAKLSASKLLYPSDLRVVAVRIAEDFGFRAAARLFGIPHPTILRWSMTPEERAVERAKTRKRNCARQYGYAFPR